METIMHVTITSTDDMDIDITVGSTDGDTGEPTRSATSAVDTDSRSPPETELPVDAVPAPPEFSNSGSQ